MRKVTVCLLSAALMLTALISAASCTPPDAGPNDLASGAAETVVTGSGSSDTLPAEATKGLNPETDSQPTEPDTRAAEAEPDFTEPDTAAPESAVPDTAVSTASVTDVITDAVIDTVTDAVSDAATDTEPQEETTTSGGIVLPKDWF